MNSEGVNFLTKHYPNNRTSKFLDWFTYSDNTIDGQSRKKAYTLFENGLLNSLEPGIMKCPLALMLRLNDREIFMKDIDCSYYYEEE